MLYFLLFIVCSTIIHQVIYYKAYKTFAFILLVFTIMFGIIVLDGGGGTFSLICVIILGILSLKPWQ